jgi:hypothetical protein
MEVANEYRECSRAVTEHKLLWEKQPRLKKPHAPAIGAVEISDSYCICMTSCRAVIIIE